jgi:hypothetical protein
MIIVICPHCKVPIIIEKINCGIFRHGEFKNGKHMDPHLPKEACEKLVKNDLIYGCGKPFQIITKEQEYETIICEYI